MNKNINTVITFMAGVAIGVLTTYKIAETKYQNIADEEIKSVIETFTGRKPSNKVSSNDGGHDVDMSKNDILDYKNNVDRFGYSTISKQTSKNNEEVEDKMSAVKEYTDKIYIISPDDYNTLDGFDAETFYYSADNYLLNSDCEVVPDDEINILMGHDPYGHFGEYEDDSVHIRNEDRMCDYEILLSRKTCAEIMEG